MLSKYSGLIDPEFFLYIMRGELLPVSNASSLYPDPLIIESILGLKVNPLEL